MTTGHRIHHINLMVDDIGLAVEFYGNALGLEMLPTPEMGFPAQFFRINDLQEIHVNELHDIAPERAHFCLRVDDFVAKFRRMKALGAIETEDVGQGPAAAERRHADVRARSRGQPDRVVVRGGPGGRSGDLRRGDLRARVPPSTVIVLLESVHSDALALLERADEVRMMSDPVELDVDVPLSEVRAVLTRGRGRITAEMYARLPNLEVVGRCGAGLDNIDIAAAKAAGITVVHAPGRTTHAVSEHALMLMLALARRLTVLDGAVKRGAWGVREGYEGVELRGKRLGVVGLGAIGRRIAELGNVLGMDVAVLEPDVA